MQNPFRSKLYVIPILTAFVGFLAVFGITVRANNDIIVVGQLWEEGLSFWQSSVVVEAGQEFKISTFGGNYSTAGAAVTVAAMVDSLPQYTSYVAGSAFQILDNSGNWQALGDDGTTPFDGAGLSVTADGTLSAQEFANYKYSVKVDTFLPTGTTELSWGGPILHFTDASGAQTKGNIESTSITVANLPNIQSFSITSGSTYKIGDTITATAAGTAGKVSHVEIGSVSFNLGGSGANYSGFYAVQPGDTVTGLTPRVFFADNGANTGSYRDAASTVSIDTILPPPASGISASVDSGTLVATLNWTLAIPETDVAQYNIYSNGGSGAIDFATPIASVPAGTNQYSTSALTADALYTFAVRSVDAAGNIEQNSTTANAATDFTAPDAPVSLVQPTTLNDTVFRFGPSNPLVFVWAPSLSDDVARYRVEVDDSSDFSSIVASLETATALTTLTATSSMLTLPDGAYYWRVFAIDDAENVSAAATAPNNIFEIDTTNPTIAVTAPTAGRHIAGNFTISGRAADSGTHMDVSGSANGLAKVEVLLTNLTSGTHWNGTAWTATSAFLTATTADDPGSGASFSNWTYAFTAPITNGNTYVTGSRATDEAGNTTDSGLVTLTGNTLSPNVSITAPSNGFFMGGGIIVSGIASDPGGTAIADVSLSIQRNSDSQYWNGSAWVAAQTWNTTATTNAFVNWTYDFTPDFSAADGTVYTVVARAQDGVFGIPNTGTSASRTITKDTTAPVLAIASPLAANSPYNAASWNAAHPIAGTSSDALSGIASVEVAIRDSAGNYWNGANWSSATAVWLGATSSDSFATWKYVNAGTDFIPNKDDDFTVYARATDAALGTANVSAPGNVAITYDTIAPVVANAMVTNSTISNITTLIKNGDVFILSATITDILQAGMAIGNITANISAITGNGADTAVVPASYNTATGAAVWNFKTAAGTGNGNVSVSINATDPAGNVAVFTDTAIIVADNTAPAITVATLTAPSAFGITWAGASVQSITWTAPAITDANLALNPITLEYSTDGTNWNAIASTEANDGAYAWTIPSLNTNTVQVRITARDQVANTSNDVSNNQFTIDSTAPVVPGSALIAPNGAEAWKQGTVHAITWDNANITDNFGLAANPITLEYSTDGTNWNVIASGEANDGTYAWTTPVIDSTTVRVRITAMDAAGFIATDISDATFSIGLPPAIVQARAVSNTLIEIEWDKFLSSAGAFANYTASGITATAATVSGGNNKIVNLTVNALANTGFTAADLAVAAGTVVDTFNFQNEAASGVNIIDRQAPQFNLGGSYPNENQLIVATRPGLRLAVSEAPGATVLTLDGNPAAYAYNSTDKLITFTPASALAFGKHTLALDLIDTAGNAASTQSWDFWIDQFSVSMDLQDVSFIYNGNMVDETGPTEVQNLQIHTYGAGFTLYARFVSDLTDGAGNAIADVDVLTPGSTHDLNGTALVQIGHVAKLDIPEDIPVAPVSVFYFDIRATIAGFLQAAGNYAGVLEFTVVPEY